jgi:small conductance mechanosensitive channel
MEAAARRGLPYIALEEGFLRSVGFGQQYVEPLSLIIDPVGIYYDSTRPSWLENLLAEGPLDDPKLLARAEAAIDLLRTERLTKFNTAPTIDEEDLDDQVGEDFVLIVDQTVYYVFPLRDRLERCVPSIGIFLRALTYLVAALIVLQLWGIPTLALLASEPGTTLLARASTIAVISGAAFVIWEVLSLVIEQTLERRAADAGGPRSARLLTLLPLLRNVARVVLLVMVTLIALSELNIDIGPLLAGAGVVGLAVGFGAQALVRDIITGAFILIEDSLAIGDWVEIGSHSGTVEAMTIRTVTLRDLHGTVHIIPFGEVTSVLNYNRAFGNAVLDVGVAYRENLEDVIAILEEIGRGLSSDPSFGPALLGPLEIAGVNNLADSAVEIRVSVKTRPMKQWGVRRELLKRIKKTFDERGIEIPFPHRTLYIAADKSGNVSPSPILHQPVQS